MTKNEDNMKKALMRGVCALNLEAMSILNESNYNNNTSLIGNQHNANKKSTNPNNNPNCTNTKPSIDINEIDLKNAINRSTEKLENLNSVDENLKQLISNRKEKQIVYDPILNRKVKEYCDYNLKLDSTSIETNSYTKKIASSRLKSDNIGIYEQNNKLDKQALNDIISKPNLIEQLQAFSEMNDKFKNYQSKKN